MSATHTYAKRRKKLSQSDRHAGPRVMLTFSDADYERLLKAGAASNIPAAATFAHKLVLDALDVLEKRA